jgi:hypothetical protein
VALVSVAVHLDPGTSEEEERTASAIFFYHAGSWHTVGKSVLNLHPEEVLAHCPEQYEPLAA